MGIRIMSCPLLLWVAGCGPHPLPISGGRLAHAEDDVAATPLALRWFVPSEGEVENLIVRKNPGKRLSDEDPRVRRVFDLVERIDSSLRATLRESSVPFPRVVVTDSAEANAFVPTVDVCFEARVVVDGAASRGVRKAVRRDARRGLLEVRDCVPLPAGEARLRDALEMVNAQNPSCPLRVENGIIHVKESCGCQGARCGFSEAESFAVRTTSNVVLVQAGLLERLSGNDELAFVLAHELAHFYRSHETAPAGSFDFFYRVFQPPRPERPRPDPEIQAVGDELRSLAGLPRFPRVPGQRWPTFVFASPVPYGKIAGAMKERCAGGSCPELCSSALSASRERLSAEAVRHVLRGLEPQGELRDAYLSLESRWAACLAAIPREMGDGALSLPSIRKIFDEELARNWPRGARDMWAQSSISGETLAEALSSSAESLEAIFVREARLKQVARDLPLGFYSSEQEADEIAFSLLERAGFRREGAFSVLRGFLREAAATEDVNALDEWHPASAQCLAWDAAGWREAAGIPVVIPIDPRGGQYHGDCYRLFHLWRESEAHPRVSP